MDTVREQLGICHSSEGGRNRDSNGGLHLARSLSCCSEEAFSDMAIVAVFILRVAAMLHQIFRLSRAHDLAIMNLVSIESSVVSASKCSDHSTNARPPHDGGGEVRGIHGVDIRSAV